MKSQNWRPLVYLPLTLGAVVVVLGLSYGIACLVHPGFSLAGLKGDEGKIAVAIACGLAYGTVMATNYLLKRYFKREFGTYLDDPDNEQTELAPGIAKLCLRCGSPFQAFRNDAHVAGFCSQSCRDRFATDKASR